MTDTSVDTSAGTDDTGPPTGMCGNAEGQLLLPDMPWNTDISGAALAGDSQAVIDYLEANVQSDARFQIDFSIPIQYADASTPKMEFTPDDGPDGTFYSPDCDPAPIPVPEGGHIEGEVGYTCDNDGDCHLIVVDYDECRLYEQWRSNFGGGAGGCLAIWELDREYDETMRGDYCSSADGAGLPIAALLFTADEIAAGEIKHAIRFILPNENIRDDSYVRPGTHAPPSTSGPGDSPPYAVTLRLRADVDISGLNSAAQVVAQAMKTYGIILADGGNITFTAAADDFTTATWDGVGLGPHDLKDLQWSDFDVIDRGPPITWSDGDCSRTPITE
jgi:serine/threonine-protein kinase